MTADDPQYVKAFFNSLDTAHTEESNRTVVHTLLLTSQLEAADDAATASDAKRERSLGEKRHRKQARTLAKQQDRLREKQPREQACEEGRQLFFFGRCASRVKQVF